MMKLWEEIFSYRGKFIVWDKLIRADEPQYHFLLILAPLMEYVYRQLNQDLRQFTHISHWLTKHFLTQLIYKDFLINVNTMIIQTCVLEMHVARRDNLLEGQTPEQRFDFFVKLLCANLPDLLTKYPVLKKQLEIYLKQFLMVHQELFKRLDQDYSQLLSTFLGSHKQYRLSAIIAAGDRHNRGRQVMILEFSDSNNSIKIVYKPRTLTIDTALQNFIVWFNQYTEIKLKLPIILAQKDYGWYEFISFASCHTEAEVTLFYYRLGCWLMLIYLLRGYDIHSENLIAHGAHPIIVDYECLIYPAVSYKDERDGQLPKFLVSSLLFLPMKINLDKVRKGVDVSALGGEGGEKVIAGRIDWMDAGKDTMYAQKMVGTLPNFLNKPSLGEKSIDYLNYEEDFVAGFATTYQLILDHRDELRKNSALIAAFKKVKTRLVARPTAEYVELLSKSWHPKYLYRKSERTELFQSFLLKDIKSYPRLQSFLASEIKDLELNCIPLFVSPTDDTVVYHGKKKFEGVIQMSAYESLATHIFDILSQHDLFFQKSLILNSFTAARLNKNVDTQRPNIYFNLLPQAQQSLSMLQEKARLLARQQLDILTERYIEFQNIPFWPCVKLKENNVWLPAFTDLHLYEGLAGIALSFAYGGALLNKQEYTDIARHSINSIRHQLLKKGPQYYAPIGGFYGIGGILYAFGRCYSLWQDQAILTDLKLLLPEILIQLEKDKSLDIISGAAGCMASLYSLSNVLPTATLLPYMRACANHLLLKYPRPDQLPLAGPVIPHTKPLLGFSHGVAGIAWALHLYASLEPRKDIKQWIASALNYERREFNSEINNWPDYRIMGLNTPASKSYMTAWCHGAVGIGLARLDMAQRYDDPKLKQEISAALANTWQEGFSIYNASLCHGYLGNLELLLYANQCGYESQESENYNHLAATILDYIEKNSFQCGPLPDYAAPGMMTGCAGIIYQLLRIADPKRVPSILLLKFA